MKRYAAIILAGLLTLNCLATVSAADIKIMADGVPVEFTDAKPYVDENGRTMVPLRPVAEAMGLDVEWDRRTRTAVFSDTYDPGIEGFGYDVEGKQVYGRIVYMSLSFKVDEPNVEMFANVKKDNGEMTMITDGFQMDTTAVVKDGRTYAPVRYMVQSFGYDVGWDAEAKTVTIDRNRI